MKSKNLKLCAKKSNTLHKKSGGVSYITVPYFGDKILKFIKESILHYGSPFEKKYR